MSIVLFPFAGGNKYSYQAIIRHIPGANVLEYPGRGARMREPLMPDLEQIVEDALVQLRKTIDTDKKYVVYGHSMGALIGYLLCHRIVDQGGRLPEKLIVSGRKPPALQRKKFISHLPDSGFWQEVIALGGIPDEVKEHTELIDYLLPVLKADFKAYETYQYAPAKKLAVPIDVFYGSDEGISKEEIEGWREESESTVNIKQLTGNHFFILNHVEYFTEYLRNQYLRQQLSGPNQYF